MSRASGRQGFILVALLGVLTLTTSLVGSAFLVLRSSVASVALADEDVALSGLLQAGVALTAHRLLLQRRPAERLSGQAIVLPGGVAVPVIRDEAGLIDLNGASPDLLAGAYAASGAHGMAPEEFAARVIDWRDADGTTGPGGAEADAYAAASLRQRPPNRPFRSVDEAAFLLGLGAGDFALVAPSLTVFNPDGKVNAATASRRVLQAVPGMTRPTLEALLERRERLAPGGAEALKEIVGSAAKSLKFEPGPIYRIEVTARAGSARSKVLRAVVTATSAETRPYHVLEWSE